MAGQELPKFLPASEEVKLFGFGGLGLLGYTLAARKTSPSFDITFAERATISSQTQPLKLALGNLQSCRLRTRLEPSSTMLPVPLLRLQCGVNSYEWGKLGNDSAAARFAAATPSEDLKIESEKPYAEVS